MAAERGPAGVRDTRPTEAEVTVVPHNIEAERAVISAVIFDPNLLDDTVDILRPERFYSEAHRWIFTAFTELRAENRPIDVETVPGWLKERNRLATVTMPYFIEVLNASPAPAHIRAHAELVHDAWRRREMIHATRLYQSEALVGHRDTQDLLSAAAQRFAEIATTNASNPVERLGEIVTASYQKIAAAASAGKTMLGMPCGFTRYDRLMSGLHDGDLTILAARPSIGKSSLAFNMAVNVAEVNRGAEVIFFSLEMPKEQLGMKAACTEARVDMAKLRTAMLTPTDWARLNEAAEFIDKLPVWVDDSAALTIAELRAKCRKVANEAEQRGNRLRLVIVDYLQLMKAVGARSREEEVASISRGLKIVAKDLGLPVIALSQLNRAVENRANKRPQMSDLRESGAIEQDADNIVFLHRQDFYKPGVDRNIAELIVDKQRNGARGVVKLRFDPQYTRFDNLADDFEDDRYTERLGGVGQ